MSATTSGRPDGIPSTIAVRRGPCDSPDVIQRKRDMVRTLQAGVAIFHAHETLTSRPVTLAVPEDAGALDRDEGRRGAPRSSGQASGAQEPHRGGARRGARG